MAGNLELGKEYELKEFQSNAKARSLKVVLPASVSGLGKDLYPSVEVPKSDDEMTSGFSSLRGSIACRHTGDDANGNPKFALSNKYLAFQTELKETQTVELKQSIIFAPNASAPGNEQFFNIAAALASFMNTDGGDLYVGVDDKGRVRGIENDLKYLSDSRAVISTSRGSDRGFTYSSADAFGLKIKHLVEYILGPLAATCIKEVAILKGNGLQYAKVSVKACAEGIIYTPAYVHGEKEEVIYTRSASGKTLQKGADRDRFVETRLKMGFEKRLQEQKEEHEKLVKEIRDNCDKRLDEAKENYEKRVEDIRKLASQSGDNSELISKIEALLSQPIISGIKPRVDGAVGISEKEITALPSFGKFIFNGCHVRDISSVKDAFLAVFEKLNDLAPEKFDQLPSNPEFSKFFIKSQPHKKYKGFYLKRFGTAEDIRAKEQANKLYFYTEKYYFRKLLAFFDVNPSSIAFASK